MDTPTLSPAGVGSPTAPPPSMDLSSMTGMVTELTRPVDRAQLDQEIEHFNLTYPVNVDGAVNLFSLPPVEGTGTALATTTTQPVTTATQTRPVTSTRTRPVTTTTRPRPVTSTRSSTRRRRDHHHHLDGDDSQWTSQNRRQTTATTSPGALSPLARFFPDDDDEDRRRGLRRRLDLLNEDTQQRARGRRIRNITHTNTVTTVYEEGGGRPSVHRTSTRTSSLSPPSSPPCRGRGRGRGQARGRGRRS